MSFDIQAAFERSRKSPEYMREGLVLDFAEAVCGRMQDLGLTYEDMADRLDYNSAKDFKHVIIGDVDITLRDVALICHVLGLKAELTVTKSTGPA